VELAEKASFPEGGDLLSDIFVGLGYARDPLPVNEEEKKGSLFLMGLFLLVAGSDLLSLGRRKEKKDSFCGNDVGQDPPWKEKRSLFRGFWLRSPTFFGMEKRKGGAPRKKDPVAHRARPDLFLGSKMICI